MSQSISTRIAILYAATLFVLVGAYAFESFPLLPQFAFDAACRAEGQCRTEAPEMRTVQTAAALQRTTRQRAAVRADADARTPVAALSAYLARTPFGPRVTSVPAGERVVLSAVSTPADGVMVNVSKDGLLRDQFRAVPEDTEGKRWTRAFIPAEAGRYRFSLFLEDNARVVANTEVILEVRAREPLAAEEVPLHATVVSRGADDAGRTLVENTRGTGAYRSSASGEYTAAAAHGVAVHAATTSAFARAQEKKQQELQRTYGEAAVCNSAAACRAVCAQGTAVSRYVCLGLIGTETKPAPVRSLLYPVDDAVIARAIQTQKITFVQTPRQARALCTNPENDQLCMEMLTQVFDVGAGEAQAVMREVAAARRELEEAIVARVGARAYLDTDGDGITDYDERRIYGTDPENPDTDADGEWDGNEIALHRNPRVRNGSAAANPYDGLVTYDDPRVAGVPMPGALEITEVVRSLPAGTATATKARIQFRGTAPPNAYVTLFIFSDPVVVTVKAREDGSWNYTLDQELHEGAHEAYSAITNGAGVIVAKSPPLFFVKRGQTITISDAPARPAPSVTPASAVPVGPSAYLLIAGGIVGIGVGLIAIIVFLGYLHYRRVGGVRISEFEQSRPEAVRTAPLYNNAAPSLGETREEDVASHGGAAAVQQGDRQLFG